MKHPLTKIGARTKLAKTNPAAQASAGAGSQSSRKLSFGSSVFLLFVASIGLLGASGYYWYQNVLTDPSRVMSDVLNKSLQTSSITRTVEQKSNQSTVKQSLYLSFTPLTVARSVTDLQESSTAGNSKVTTETIGTTDTDFVRYEAIDVSSRSTAKQNFDSVLNTWGKRQNSQDPKLAGQQVSFLNDALFVAIPFGNLNADQRKQLTEEIKKAKLYDTGKAEQKFEKGRPVMTYTMDISPQSLVQVLAKYVELTGVGSSADLDPAQYEGAAKIQVSMKIDLLSRHIKQIEFLDSGRVETYGAYNLERNIEIPEQTINIDELQDRLSKIEEKYQQAQPAATPTQN